MKGVRFYLEYKDAAAKRRGEHEGNCVAVFPELRQITGNFDAVCAVYFQRNSPCASTGAHPDFLRERCKRISEAKAREIHPNLFVYLDAD
jgi:hypothetical protein